MSGFFDATQDGVTTESADFVVVGSGAGGGAAARALAVAGHSVVVLEDGPPFSAATTGPIAHESMVRLCRHKGQFAALGRAAIPILQGRCVGGTTAINSAIIWRLPGAVLKRWHHEHGLADDLPEAALERAYEMLEREMHVQAVQPEAESGSDRLMRAGAMATDLSHQAIRRSERGCRGSSRCLHGCPNDAKQSTAINFLRVATEHGASVYAHSEVRRVHVEGGRAAAVSGRIGGSGSQKGRRFRVAARRAVVLAASVIQTPNLLRRSGIARGSEALGEHFMAHPGTSVMALYRAPVHMWNGAAQGYEVTGLRDRLGIKLESINVPPEVVAGRLPGAGQRLRAYLERLNHVAAWAVAVRMDAEGTVRPSFIQGDSVRYTPTEHDMWRMREGMKRTAELHFLAGAEEVLSGVHGMPERLTGPEQLHWYDEASLDPRCYQIVATHLFGTCRAGSDARTAVVDGRLQVHGVPGLHVMDASVFPSNTGVNPQHSIMAVATVAAERLAGG